MKKPAAVIRTIGQAVARRSRKETIFIRNLFIAYGGRKVEPISVNLYLAFSGKSNEEKAERGKRGTVMPVFLVCGIFSKAAKAALSAAIYTKRISAAISK